MPKSSRLGRTGLSSMTWALIACVVVTGLVVWYFARPLKGTVAIVNGRVITKAMMYEEMKKRAGNETLQALIDNTIVTQEAALKNIKLTDEEFKAEMDKIIAEEYGSEEYFLQLLDYYGLTREQIEAEWRTYFTARKVIISDLNITDADLTAYFESNRVNYDQTYGVHLRKIVLQTQEEADAVLADIKAGGDFAEIAKEKSTDTATKESGGDLGWVEEGDLEEALKTVAFALEVNEVSEPVETKDGFVIFEAVEKRDAKQAVFDEVRDKVTEDYQEAKINETYSTWINNLRSKATIQYK